jgi:excisionase family DNA binding protein
MDELLTVAEVAETLKVNQQSVRNWIDRRELPVGRVGQRRVRIRRSDLERYLEAGATVAVGEEAAGNAAGESEERWDELRAALASSNSIVEAGRLDELVEVLGELARSAQELADALSDSEPSKTSRKPSSARRRRGVRAAESGRAR